MCTRCTSEIQIKEHRSDWSSFGCQKNNSEIFFIDFCKRLEIEVVMEEIGIKILRGSSRIILYDPQRC